MMKILIKLYFKSILASQNLLRPQDAILASLHFMSFCIIDMSLKVFWQLLHYEEKYLLLALCLVIIHFLDLIKHT